MKKVLLAAMTVVLLGATAQAATYNKSVNHTINTGWMNVGVTAPTDWGSGWGVADLRSTLTGYDNLYLQTNVNGADDNVGDPYWNPGALQMEANTYGEQYVLLGDTINFSYHTVANELSSQGYLVEAWIKVLNSNGGWETVQNERLDISALGDGFISVVASIEGTAQYGFSVTGDNDISGSGTADLGVTVIPEPATIGLVGIAGLGMFVARRRFSI